MRVYLCHAGDLPACVLEKMRAKLPPVRKFSVERCKNQAVRDCRTLAFYLVRYALMRDLPALPFTDFEIAEGGKPMLPDQPLHFSISYSDDTVAVALAPHPVGLDIERVRPMRDGFAARWMTEEEQAAIAASHDPDTALLECWVRREAAVKRSGEGLHYRKDIDTADTASLTWETKNGTLAIAVCPAEDVAILPVCAGDLFKEADL